MRSSARPLRIFMSRLRWTLGSEQGDTTQFPASCGRTLLCRVVRHLSARAIRSPRNGSGVGCGYYDESGAEDGGGISRLMNEYVFGFCYSPVVDGDNVLLFLDHCLAHLSNPFHTGREEEGYVATKSGLPGGLDPKAMGRYWLTHRDHIRGLELQDKGDASISLATRPSIATTSMGCSPYSMTWLRSQPQLA